ncbi:aminodeoxychorismate lyase [Evansella tamaricis]|uniref:Aminodeoxychorismate lyase n=1 Tax=Evansella tamaricis TaxID=2069301 RepID=A0ABS6JA49_9BACI|nr:aminodeoxychorismate lyase [Evansella tamaricis]MBU9710485.1 aminodeoxychorismate lyase [Evansella tamaricis]
MYLYMNGVIDHYTNIKISPLDHGFLYGLGLFETFRTYHGHPFLLDDHFQRLKDSAEELNIQLPSYNREKTVQIIELLLEKNGLEDGYFRWNISAGEREIGLSTSPYLYPNTVVFVKPLPRELKEKKGVFLKQRRNSPEGAQRLKSHHYLNNIIGKREIGSNGEIEGIFLSEKDVVSEGIVSNVLWWKSNVLYTPSVSSGCLDGITKKFIIAIAKDLKLEVREGEYSPSHLLDADEVFVTNSIQGIVPLQEVDQMQFPGTLGPIYKALKTRYKACTDRLWSVTERMEME